MAFKGMNPEEGREVASLVDEAGTVVNDNTDSRTTQIMSAEWVGPDYDDFTADWNAFLSGALQTLSDAYNTKASELNEHAEQQDATSNQG